MVVFKVKSGPTAMASVFRAVKQPAETVTYGILYREFLPSGVSLVSSSVEVHGPDTSLRIEASNVDVAESKVIITVSGGTNRKTYKVESLTTLSNGDRVQDEIYIYVRDY